MNQTQFSVANACLATHEHSGFSLEDICHILGVCPSCERVVLREHFVLHICP